MENENTIPKNEENEIEKEAANEKDSSEMDEQNQKIIKDDHPVEAEHHKFHIPNRQEIAGTAAMFRKYMYNKEEGTVMGRNSKTWGRILSFYLVYYAFLTALGLISIEILKGSVSFYTPSLQTRLQFPATKMVPITEYDESHEYQITNDRTKQSEYKDLIDQIKVFLEPYRKPGYSNSSESVKVCDEEGIQHLDYSDSDTKEADSCFFDLTQIDPVCIDETQDFGYAVGTPCIFLSLNRIIGWKPAPFLDLKSKNSRFPDKAIALYDWLSEIYDGNYNKTLSYVVCNQQDMTSNKTVSDLNVSMTPAGGLHSKYYPFLGSRRQPSYRAPFVAVKFAPKSKSTTNTIKEEWVCRIYSRNIVTETDITVGGLEFKLEVAP